ncbi:MAG: lipopolysaccharide biosynthesis protein [Gammaproteobacteria bacterium]|nr:lipopolysaccharide biosynthesis protein [Gammaproteobacteria bacterium]
MNAVIENMEQEEIKSLGEYLDVFKRRKKQFIVTASVVFIIAIAIAFLLPAMYRTSATILIEQQEIPQDLVRSTITTYADQRIQITSQRVMTTTNLMSIVDKFNLYQDDLEKKTREEVLDEMRSNIGMEPLVAEVVDPRTGRPSAATIALQLSFEHKNPELAQKVANELVSLFLNENVRTRTEKSAETSFFLSEELRRLGDEVSKLEGKLAEFKEGNVERLPELLTFNMQLMERTESELIEIDRLMQDVKERKIYLESQLTQLEPNATLYSSSGQRIMGKDSRLKTLQAEYITLSSLYSETHPDVLKMKKEIDALEKELGKQPTKTELQLQLKKLKTEYVALSEKYSAEHPDVKEMLQAMTRLEQEISLAKDNVKPAPVTEPDNPAYIQLKAQLDAADTELRSLHTKKQTVKKRLDDYEQRITNSPKIEQNYRGITRDYENTVAKYQEVKAKQMEAQIAEELEKERKGERFTLIEPPLLPEIPTSPNRVMIVLLGVILAFGIGLGTVAIMESVDDSIRGIKSIEGIFGMTPLATIPYISTDSEIIESQAVIPRFKYLIITVVGFIVALVAVNYLYKPLDVLWFIILRKLGV